MQGLNLIILLLFVSSFACNRKVTINAGHLATNPYINDTVIVKMDSFNESPVAVIKNIAYTGMNNIIHDTIKKTVNLMIYKKNIATSYSYSTYIYKCIIIRLYPSLMGNEDKYRESFLSCDTVLIETPINITGKTYLCTLEWQNSCEWPMGCAMKVKKIILPYYDNYMFSEDAWKYSKCNELPKKHFNMRKKGLHLGGVKFER